MDWLVHTLRQYPELAIFLTLGLGYFIGKKKVREFQPGGGHRHPPGRSGHWPATYHHLPQCQGRLLPHVPLCGGLRGGSPVLSGPQERRVVPGPVCRPPLPDLPVLHLSGRRALRVRSGLGLGAALGRLHHFGGDRGGHRHHKSTVDLGQNKKRRISTRSRWPTR